MHTLTFAKNITSYTFLFVFKIVESLQCILNYSLEKWKKNSWYSEINLFFFATQKRKLSQIMYFLFIENDAINLDPNYVHFCEKRMRNLMADKSPSMIELQVILFRAYTGHWQKVIVNSCLSFFEFWSIFVFQNKVTVKKKI